MSRATLWPLALATLLSVAVFGAWFATGRHAYTKYQVVEQVERKIPDDDPFADTGLYEGEEQVETVERDEFHLGLLPTPQGLFDKHAVSLVTIVVPVWAIFGLLAWRLRSRK